LTIQHSKDKSKSVRRAAGVSRRAILDAAGKRLAEGGPEAVRIQEVARDVGLSHPTVLHHFGSREGLMNALIEEMQERLSAEVSRAFAGPIQESTGISLVLRLFETLADSGQARLLAWRGLTLGAPLEEHSEQTLFQQLIDMTHSRRVEYARDHGLELPTREDSVFVVRLLNAILLGDGLAGPAFNLRAELDGQKDSQERFRAWTARLVTAHTTPHVTSEVESDASS
jgi:AcrR family transcriptional regulator